MVTVANLRKDGTLSWLHLSDIHFGEAQGTGRDAVLNRLIDDVRKLRERDQLAPDLIFITGDIAWSGKPNQYEKQAKPFLEKLQAAADVEPSRIFLIPGNHDVDRSQIKSIALKKFQEDLIAPPAGENAQKFVTDFLTWDDFQDDRDRLLLKHKAYVEFVTAHFPHCMPEIVPCAYTCPVEFPKGALPFEKLWVVGLNTAWLGRDGEDKGKLLLGYEQIQQALNVIENHGSWSRDFILALTHHPLSWLPEWDERLCQQQIETRCDFHLSGHLHETHFNLRGVGGPQRCSEIAAGSAYGGSQWYNGYNLVELDFQTGKGRATLRRFEPTITAWKPDIRFERLQPGQFIPFWNGVFVLQEG